MLFGRRKMSWSTVLKISYVIVLVTTVFYVKSVISTDSFMAKEKEQTEPTEKIRAADVVLVVETSQGVKEYKGRLRTNDSVEDFLSELRDTQDMYYERDLYTYGSVITQVYGKEPALDNRWAVLSNGEEITNKIANVYLTDHAVYTLKELPNK